MVEETEKADSDDAYSIAQSLTREQEEDIIRRHDYLELEDAKELTRLASLAKQQSSASLRNGSIRKEWEELDRYLTLQGLSLEDDVFDPNSDKFDLYKWIRLNTKLTVEGGIKVKRTGLAFRNVNVRGTGPALSIQSTVGSLLSAPMRIGEIWSSRRKVPRHILKDFNGYVRSGELLVVLGRPGAGCSTLLKTLTGETYGLQQDHDSVVHYNGIKQTQMMKEFKGEVIYNQEVDKHFPHLTVGQTLEHAAAMRMPQNRPYQGSRQDAVEHITRVIMAVYGLSHTYNTKVGNDFIRGVSGGERKRVSIAEMALAKSSVAAWDNSTRGLDSATALKFVKALRVNADLDGSAHIVAIYQASQPIYDIFDKVVVLYEGRQIYFGRAKDGKAFFERQGWCCPPRQTTGDFLTSVTNPGERKPRPGYESKVPRTPDEFEAYWRNSPEYTKLQQEIAEYEEEHVEQDELQAFREYKRSTQSKHTRGQSPYTISVLMQIRLNTKRAWQRILGDPPATVAPIVMNVIMALLIGSMYFGKPSDTSTFGNKIAALFFAILICVFSAIAEVNALWEQRPIVEKHKSYAFYHPATEAIAGIVIDVLPKFLLAVAFNLVIYFLSGLRAEAGNFFLYFLITYMATFTMAALFRSIAALTATISEAMTYSGVLLLAVGVYTGFMIPTQYMKDWFGWIRHINPVFYSFEILVSNEFHGREYDCAEFVPNYANMTGNTFICTTQGSVAGELRVSGDAFIDTAFGYTYNHAWRNFGILVAFLVGFLTFYFVIVELNSSTASKAEVLVFRRDRVPDYLKRGGTKKVADVEAGKDNPALSKELSAQKSNGTSHQGFQITPQTDIFTWRNVTYDIEIKGEPRRLLDDIHGYVKPGTLTALMGTSGAGKTTLLDVLAQRTSIGVVTGSMFVNGASLDASFQRKTGYVQQQDLHLDTATVRESLRFSALLRQPQNVSREEKFAYVEQVIKLLNMEEFAEAVVGVPGEGLNVEQRKLLTIGVELAAKPKLLLFLDEPTSGLDSQSAWAICSLLRKLADNGQAVLCTIHQPSATLFAQFDRLLFLRKGGQTVYFGEIGQDYKTLLNYFSRNGAKACGPDENPAEYMLDVIGDETSDWVSTWRNSPEAESLLGEIEEIHGQQRNVNTSPLDEQELKLSQSEFAMPLSFQIAETTKRVFQQYWRMPGYITAKLALGFGSGLFIGFSFYDAKSSLQGMQNILYSVFMVVAVFNNITQQVMPLFVTQRALYEVRERPSKAYSWKAFLIANMIVEVPWQILTGILTWTVYYYPVVGAGQSSERQVLVLLLFITFFVYASVFAHMCIVVMPDALTASTVVVLLFSMMLIFCGVMQPPSELPGFWMFMYRTSPITYLISSVATTMMHQRPIECSASEINVFQPPSGQTCGEYMADYLTTAAGALQNPDATSDCGYCSLRVTDQYLANFGMHYGNRWRDLGIVWVVVLASAGITVSLYYIFRVLPVQRKRKRQVETKKN